MPRITRAFESAPAALQTIIIMASVLLTVLAGMFMVIGMLLGTAILAVTKGAAAPSTVLLTIAIILLGLVLVLLVVLMGCCGCLSGKGRLPGELLAFVPLLSQLPGLMTKLGPALVALSTALRGTRDALEVVHTNLAAAGDPSDLATDFGFPSPKFGTEEVPGFPGFYYVTNIDLLNMEPLPVEWLEPLKGAIDTLDASLDNFGTVVDDLGHAATLLEDVANALPQT